MFMSTTRRVILYLYGYNFCFLFSYGKRYWFGTLVFYRTQLMVYLLNELVYFLSDNMADFPCTFTSLYIYMWCATVRLANYCFPHFYWSALKCCFLIRKLICAKMSLEHCYFKRENIQNTFISTYSHFLVKKAILLKHFIKHVSFKGDQRSKINLKS